MPLDPLKFRPRDGWCVVLAEPRKEKLDSGLILPMETHAEKVTEGAGRIVRAGPGKRNALLGLENGQRVIFRSYLKYANPLETEEVWPDGSKKAYFVMSSEDILAVVPDDTDIGVFSGRPMVPERK